VDEGAFERWYRDAPQPQGSNGNRAVFTVSDRAIELGLINDP
jgi:hypothetical protein